MTKRKQRKIWLAAGETDMRRGFITLAAQTEKTSKRGAGHHAVDAGGGYADVEILLIEVKKGVPASRTV